MKRGEIWTAAGGGDYSGKPRPVIVLQDDHFEDLNSVTVCALTTDPTDSPLFRIAVEPKADNGLDTLSRIMVDKITTVRRERLRERIGKLDAKDVVRLNRAVLVFLGLGGGSKA